MTDDEEIPPNVTRPRGRPPGSRPRQDQLDGRSRFDPASRRRRIDAGDPNGRKGLHVDKEHLDGEYVYRWINGTPARVQATMIRDDWSEVSPDEAADPVRPIGGDPVNGQLVAKLVKKPRVWHKQDRDARQRAIAERMEQAERGALRPDGEGLDPAAAYIPPSVKNRLE